MKNIPIKLLDHYNSDVNTICILVKITLKNGTVLGFTDVDVDVFFDNILFKKSSGITPSAISYSASLSVTNLEFDGMMTNEDFTESDIRAGMFNNSKIEMFRCNYKKIEDGVEILPVGFIGDIQISNTKFTFEIRGLAQKLQDSVGRKYMPACDANFGDFRCSKMIENYTVTGIVQDSDFGNIVIDKNRAEPEGWFNYGLFTFTSGENAGYSIEVKSFKDGVFELQLPFFKKIKYGDTYSVYAGCDKSLNMCKAKFNNVLNFRGFPAIPLPSTVMDLGV